ncbi:MAG: alpha/beta hydrolase [Myxococcales bacterium]
MILPFSAVLWAGHALYRAQGFTARSLRAAGRRALLYERSGSGAGPPALLVHGLGGNAASWLKLVPALSRCCSGVAVVDLPGHGRAPLAPGETPLGPVELAEALGVALAAVAAPGRPVLLIGNSLGGALCLNAAALAPELVCGVVGLSPAGAPLTAADRAALLRAFGGGAQGGISEMARLLYHRPPRSLWLFGRGLAALWGSPPVQHVLAQLPGDAAPGLAPDLLEQLAQPALVLWGDSDGILPASSVQFFRAHLRTGTVEIIERCGHVPQLERPAAVGKRIARFVAGLQAVPGPRAESA